MIKLVLFKRKADMKPKPLSFIDLFAGIGGFRQALESFGLKCVFSSEWDSQAQRTYLANYGEIPHGDITKIDEASIPKHEIICGGFPCQAFSISGKQKGFEDARGTLFFDVVRIAKLHKPKVLFLENVKNFASHDNGNTLKTVLSILNEIGYDVYYKVLNASHYGAPTSRERIYLVCFRKDLKIGAFKFPAALSSKVSLQDFLDPDDDTSKYVIQRDDIKLKEEVPLIADLLGNYPQKPIRVGSIGKGGQGERIYSPLGHAITFSAYGGGVASKTGAYLIDGKVRKLSPRECARVMGFGDNFIIPVSDSQAYKQFGNSVVVNVVKAIMSEILLRL